MHGVMPNRQIGRKTGHKRIKLDHREKRLRTALRNPMFRSVFLVCFSTSFGGHLWKNCGKCFYEGLELLWLLNCEPFLFIVGRNRLS